MVKKHLNFGRHFGYIKVVTHQPEYIHIVGLFLLRDKRAENNKSSNLSSFGSHLVNALQL